MRLFLSERNLDGFERWGDNTRFDPPHIIVIRSACKMYTTRPYSAPFFCVYFAFIGMSFLIDVYYTCTLRSIESISAPIIKKKINKNRSGLRFLSKRFSRLMNRRIEHQCHSIITNRSTDNPINWLGSINNYHVQ